MLLRTIISFFLLLPCLLHAANGPLEKLARELDQTAAYMVAYSKFAQDPLLNPLAIHLKMENGTVIVEGMVDTDIQYDEVLHILQQTPGVDKVDASNLKITTSNQPYQDAWITTKIKIHLFKDRYLRGDDVVWPVRVSTKNGKVYAVGVAVNLEQKLHTAKVIKSISGVNDLHANFKVNELNTHE